MGASAEVSTRSPIKKSINKEPILSDGLLIDGEDGIRTHVRLRAN